MISRALVPISAGPSPPDVGSFAEALVYCDRVGVLADSPQPLAQLIDWFLHPGEVETFLMYLRDGVIEFVDAEPATFRSRVLDHPAIAQLMKGQWRHSRLLTYTAGRVVEARTGFTASDATGLWHLARDLDRHLFAHASLGDALHRAVAAEGEVREISCDVAFPDVRAGVAAGRIGLRDLQDLRRAAKPLRQWLGSGTRSDLAAFASLHDGIAASASRAGRTMLSVFGPAQRSGSLVFAQFDRTCHGRELR